MIVEQPLSFRIEYSLFTFSRTQFFFKSIPKQETGNPNHVTYLYGCFLFSHTYTDHASRADASDAKLIALTHTLFEHQRAHQANLAATEARFKGLSVSVRVSVSVWDGDGWIECGLLGEVRCD